jgi:hypothetical protein
MKTKSTKAGRCFPVQLGMNYIPMKTSGHLDGVYSKIRANL